MVKSFCNPDLRSTRSTVDKQILIDIGQKLEADSISYETEKDVLYSLWENHPYLSKYCCMYKEDIYLTHFLNMLTFGNDFYDYVPLYEVGSELRKEIDRICPTKMNDKFCGITGALPIIDLIATLPKIKSEWTDIDEELKDLIVMHATLLTKENSYYKSLDNLLTREAVQLTINRIINYIIMYIQENNDDRLRNIQKNLPRLNEYSQRQSGCQSEDICIFMKIVQQLDNYVEQKELSYSNPELKNKKQRILVNTGTDYKEFLKQKKLERILQVITQQKITSLSIANALKGQMTSSFSQLKSYFEQVANFNGAIAEADIAFISGRQIIFKQRIDSVVGSFKLKMTNLLTQMMIGAGLEIVQSAITMAITIVDACNPLGFIFGGADPKDLMDAIAEVTNAVKQLTKGSIVLSTWTAVQSRSVEINKKFKKNDDFLANVKRLMFNKAESREDFEKAKNSFLELYNKYDPQVLPDELVEISSLWSGLVEAACDVTNSFNTAAGITASAVVKGQNLCVDLPVLADRMGELYENIYDYQFDMMDALAEYTRAKVTIDAAKEISTELTTITNEDPEDEETLNKLQIMGGLTFMTYKTHMLGIITHYCNILEYKEGGRKPSECKGTDTSTALLIAKVRSTCTYQTLDYYQVPTTPSGSNDLAYVDISELYKGATVNFKIPDSQWLIDHKWIREDERDVAFFVEQLQVYLPTKPNSPMKFRVTADPTSQNQIIPTSDSKEYIIVPHLPLITEFKMGPSRTKCPVELVSNPYTTCNMKDPSFICPLTTSFHFLYPSLYTQWTITVSGGEDLIPPDSATDMSVIFGLKLCKVAPQRDYDQVELAHVSEELSDCCSSGQYRSTMQAECMQCPQNSHSALDGYYCEKN